MDGFLSVLIVAQPGRLRDGLQTIVQSLPGVAQVIHADASQTSLSLAARKQPDVIIIDADPLCRDTRAALQNIYNQSPWSKTIVLVNTTEQRWACDPFADTVLLKGFTTAVLSATLTELFPHHATYPLKQSLLR